MLSRATSSFSGITTPLSAPVWLILPETDIPNSSEVMVPILRNASDFHF